MPGLLGEGDDLRLSDGHPPEGQLPVQNGVRGGEEEKRRANSARLFGHALTTEPPNKPDGGSSASGTRVLTRESA